MRSLLAACLALLCALPAVAQPSDSSFSLILEGGLVYDGLGNPPVVADVGIVAERIVSIGDLSGRAAEERVDVRGLAVVPGFIDIHSHADGGIEAHPLAENYLRQGVTTAIGGQDGSSALPVGAFLKKVERARPAINFGMFAGHGTIRAHVLGAASRAPTEAEMAQMQALLRQAMDDGAFGLSSGLEYTPGAWATTDELVELAKAMAPSGGVYISHIRDEGARLLESVAEVIRVGEEAGVAAQVTHHKVIGPDRWGRTAESLALIEEARARGVDVTSDVYPYTASSTGLTILFPDWSKEGGNLTARLRDPATRARIHADVVAHIHAERGGDPATIVAANCQWDASRNGKSLADMLAEAERPATVEEAATLVLELQKRGGCQGVFHSMAEADVVRLMQHPTTMISSDGGIRTPGVGVPHPRNYGAFARVLARYVREQNVLSFEEAVRKITSLPAHRLGLRDRGVLRPGALADLAVLDPTMIIDTATFEAPHQYAEGVAHVLVGGTFVLRDGAVTGARPGRVLRQGER